jgi:hypothetical protein
MPILPFSIQSQQVSLLATEQTGDRSGELI